MTDHIIEELKRYAQIIEQDGIETQEIYELMGLLYKAIGILKEQDKKIEESDRFISLMCGKCAYKQDDKAMIEKMKCCGNCDNLWQEECSLSPESKNKCLENKSYLFWELKK